MENLSENRLPDIRRTIIVDASIQKVWQAVATSEGMAAWFMPSDFQPVQGHKFYLDAGPLGLTPCKLTLIEPPNRLSFEWGKDWQLTFELSDLGGQTEITVVHSGWDANKVAESGRPHTVVHERMTQAWTVLINRLIRRAINKKENQTISINSGEIDMQQTRLQVSGIMCNHCVKSVEEALKALGASGRVDLNRGTVFVEYDENKVTMEAMKDAIEYLGYDVS